MLEKIFKELQKDRPTKDSKQQFKVKQPKLKHEGKRRKRTIWMNFDDCCTSIKRKNEHVYMFMNTELGI